MTEPNWQTAYENLLKDWGTDQETIKGLRVEIERLKAVQDYITRFEPTYK